MAETQISRPWRLAARLALIALVTTLALGVYRFAHWPMISMVTFFWVQWACAELTLGWRDK